MEIQSILELQIAKDTILYLQREESTRTLSDEEFLRMEQLKDDVEYFEEFIM